MKAWMFLILAALLSAGALRAEGPQLRPHPRLYLNRSTEGRIPGVAEIRARAADPQFAAAWSRVKDSSNPACLALAWLADGDTSRLGDLRKALRRKPGSAEPLAEQALAFDWSYDVWSAAERKEFAGCLMDGVEAMLKHYNMDCVYHNYTRGPHMAHGLAMLAAWENDPRAPQHLAVVKRQMDELLEILADSARLDDMAGRAGWGGGWPEGYDYDRHGGFYSLQFLLGWRSAGLGDYFSGSRYWRDKILWLTYGTGPDGSFVEGYEDNDWPFPMRHDREMLTALAHEYGSGLARRWCDTFADTLQSRPWWEFVFADPSVAPAGPEELPTGRLIPGLGLALLRSSWDKDAAYVRFHCGPWYTYHQHDAQGSVTAWRDGSARLIEPGVYDGEVHGHYVNWRIRTISHNSLTVLDPTERFHGPEAVPVPANDGGQVIQEWTLKPANMSQWREQSGLRSTGKITVFLNDRSHDLVAGEAAGAYTPGKVQRWSRQMLFLKPGWIVLCDLVSAPAEYPKTIYFHSPAELNASGQGVEAAGTFRAFCLLPAQAKLNLAGGPGKTFAYGGENWSTIPAYNAQVDTAWRLEVEAPRQESTVFLTAIYLPRHGESSAPKATLLDSGPERVSLSLEGGYTVTLSPGDPEAYSLSGPGVTYSLSGVVAADGLAQEGETVSLSGAATATAVTDSHGEFLFQGLTPGDYTLTRAATGQTRRVAISESSVGGIRF